MSVPRPQLTRTTLKDYAERLVADDAGATAGPQLKVCVPVTVPDAATGDVDVIMNEKFEVTDIECVKRNGAGAGNTVTVKNGATAISNAIACDTDDAVTRAGSIIDGAGTNVIAAGGTLRLTCTRAAGTRNSQIFVYGFIRP